MVANGFFEAIDEAVTGFNCFAARQIMGNPLRNFPPMLLLVPQATFILQSGRCGTAPPNVQLPGIGAPMRGGQCPVNYRVVARACVRRGDGAVICASTQESIQIGPVSPIEMTRTPADPPGSSNYALNFFYRNGNGTIVNIESFFGGGSANNQLEFGSATFLTLARQDGQPDNCGDTPPVVYPPLVRPNPYPEPDPTDPDRIWPNITIPVIYAPFNFSAPITINVNFGGFKVTADVKIPITIPVDIGGVKIGDIIFRPESEPEYRPNPAPTGGDSPTPPECPDTTTIVVPFAIRESCSQSSAELEVISDSLPPALVGRLIDTVNLALECCGEEPKPPQEPEVEIGNGTAPNPAGEQFVNVPDECVSVRLRITSPGAARQVTTYGTAGQRKYGSLGFAMLNMQGGGDYVYVYDSDTYYPLPPRGKPGRIRLLLSPGVAWQLYDTGERL